MDFEYKTFRFFKREYYDNEIDFLNYLIREIGNVSVGDPIFYEEEWEELGDEYPIKTEDIRNDEDLLLFVKMYGGEEGTLFEEPLKYKDLLYRIANKYLGYDLK